MSRAGLRARAADFFIEPRQAPAEPVPASTAAPARAQAATRLPLRAAVLGTAGEAPPVAALLANALRSAAAAPAAAVALWSAGAESSPPRSGPAAPAASKLAGRLTARGLPAAARGRLAWLRLDGHPVAAAVAARRVAGGLEVPLVVVLAGPRCEVVEGLLGEVDLAVVVGEPDGPLARLAVAGCPGAAVAHSPSPPGPSRWLALAGVTGARALAAPVRDLVRVLAAPPSEMAW